MKVHQKKTWNIYVVSIFFLEDSEESFAENLFEQNFM